MTAEFFAAPILNSPYAPPARHWELDETGQPTQRIADGRRKASFVTPIPKARKQTKAQTTLVLDEGKGLSTEAQQYDVRSLINELRIQVERWRELKNPDHWRVTPETRRLLLHWRTHNFSGVRPFFCQIEAVETVVCGEDAKEKANTMRQYWVPAVNNDGRFGRWAVAEFTDVYAMEAEFIATLDAAVSALLGPTVEVVHA